jgi:hypothetical protein
MLSTTWLTFQAVRVRYSLFLPVLPLQPSTCTVLVMVEILGLGATSFFHSLRHKL